MDARHHDGGLSNLRTGRRNLAGTLSGGEQQATAIGRALMMNPGASLLDEVSLRPVASGHRSPYVRLEALKSSGVAMLGRAGSEGAVDRKPHHLHARRRNRDRRADAHAEPESRSRKPISG